MVGVFGLFVRRNRGMWRGWDIEGHEEKGLDYCVAVDGRVKVIK